MNVEAFVALLDGVTRHGSGYRCKCPVAHHSDKNRSLSVGVGDEGRILLNCFSSGCSALEIVHALGLELSDLFPERITHDSTPQQRREIRAAVRQSQWAAALDTLEFESRIVAIAGNQLGTGEPLNDEDWQRFVLALERIESARAVFRGR